VHAHRGTYLVHLAAHVVVSGIIAYGQSTEGVPAAEGDPWRVPVWWRSDARRDLDHLEEYCAALRAEHRLPDVERPPSRE
jgi:hypothetical protein